MWKLLYQLVKELYQSTRLFLHSIFPDLCLACSNENKAGKSIFCVRCIYEMPYTDHFEIQTNDLMHHFKGRERIRYGAALLNFYDKSITEKLLHNLKYHGMKEIGILLGEIAGKKYLASPHYYHHDIILPVPLHRKKIKLRGYNQSLLFAQGINKVLNIEVSDDTLIKVVANESQTGKTRSKRLENVENVFQLNAQHTLCNKNVLLVDDVVTTGATLEACAKLLHDAKVNTITIITIAIAK